MKILSTVVCLFVAITCTSRHFTGIESTSLDINVYVINLDRHPHKLEFMQRQLDFLQLGFVRIPAVDGKVMQRVVSENRSDERTHSTFGLDERSKLDLAHVDMEFNAVGSDGSVYSKGSHYGVIGCMQSHIKTYFQIIDKAAMGHDADRPSLILEDDVLMERNFASLLREALRVIATDWEVFAIGHIEGTCIDVHQSSGISPDVPCRSHHFYATHAYLVRNATVAQRLLSYSNTPEPQIADHYWLPHFREDLAAYILFPRTIADQNQLVFRSELRGFQQQVPALQDPIDTDWGSGSMRFDGETVGVEDLFAQNMLHEMEYNELFASQIVDKYFEHPHNAYFNNLMGVLSSLRGDDEQAVEYFRRTCVLDGFTNEGYIRNYVSRGYSRDPDAVVLVLEAAIDGFYAAVGQHPTHSNWTAPDALLYLGLIDIYELRHRRDLAYHVVCRAVLTLTHNYDLWTIFMRYHFDLYLSVDALQAMEQRGPERRGLSSSSSSTVHYSLGPQQDRIVRLGLQMFPRSPELLLIHALHVHYSMDRSDTTMESRARCSLHFLRLSRQLRALRVMNVSSDLLKLSRQLFDHRLSKYPRRDDNAAGWSAASCSPVLDRHDLDSWRTHTSAIGHEFVLPSLQIGCSEWRQCVKVGWLIVDAVESISTHFVTAAHDLFMVSDRSVQSVYSSHTLEHLSRLQVEAALREWRRVLMPMGRLMVAVPDLDAIAAAFSDQQRSAEEKRVLMLMLYGGQNNEHGQHCSPAYCLPLTHVHLYHLTVFPSTYKTSIGAASTSTTYKSCSTPQDSAPSSGWSTSDCSMTSAVSPMRVSTSASTYKL